MTSVTRGDLSALARTEVDGLHRRFLSYLHIVAALWSTETRASSWARLVTRRVRRLTGRMSIARISCTRTCYTLAMLKNPHEVLATREARAQLPAMLERFRSAGAAAEPIVIGARRRPEAVVMSYERYLQLAGGRERVRAILERQAAEIGAGVDADESLELANRELHATRKAGRTPRR